ncbi:hypothetical protein CFP56_006218 [Quercus suber]|uniref:Uncharacterized protein n=1 Tax=Quercus suber TaxID=58331 RepID=A0AAW0L8J0_QUESU
MSHLSQSQPILDPSTCHALTLPFKSNDGKHASYVKDPGPGSNEGQTSRRFRIPNRKKPQTRKTSSEENIKNHFEKTLSSSLSFSRRRFAGTLIRSAGNQNNSAVRAVDERTIGEQLRDQTGRISSPDGGSILLLLLLRIVMEFSEMQLNDDAFELCPEMLKT